MSESRKPSAKKIFLVLLGSFIQAFAVYNIHSVSNVTEGGMLGLELLGNHWLGLSPAISGAVLSAICYFFGWKTFGKSFINYSILATGGYSVFYALLELFPRLYPQISEMPLAASVIGGVLIGTGAGLCVRCGGAASGDDALAMSISKRRNIKIQHIYLASDLTVLLISLTYIPIRRILYSVLTVFISGRIVGIITDFRKKAK